MKRQIPKLPFLLVALIVASATILSVFQNRSALAYPAGCVTQACREAYDAANAAASAAASAKNNARTLEGEIAKLNSEIAALEAQIAANQAVAADLKIQITETEAKLSLQQSALAQLLVDMHFEQKSDAIILLAGSSTIGELAEKQTRQDNAKTQISASAKLVRETKEKLEADKAEVDARIANAESSRAEIEEKRAAQAALKAKYQNDAAAYAADAEAANAAMLDEINEYNRTHGTGGVVAYGVDSYPYSDKCPENTLYNINYGIGAYGGYVCQCTSYAGWKAYERWGVLISAWGNAKYWSNNGSISRQDTSGHAYRIDRVAAPNTVAVSSAGPYGHVMWVEAVNANGTIKLSEYNYTKVGDFTVRDNVPAGQFYYIHFDQMVY